MADIIKDSYNESNRFSKVIFQRAKDVIDFELNEAQDDLRIDKYRSAFAIGGQGSPDVGLFVEASGAANQVTIKAGHFDFQGAHLLFPSDTVFSALTTNPGPSSRVDRIYASLTEVEVADPEQMSELGETTRRRQLVVTFGVAEGTAIPTDSAEDFWAGGTKYVELSAITRAAGVATIDQVDCSDSRGRLPRAALDLFTEKDQSTTSKRTKVIVQALDAETSTNPQLGVRQESGALAFKVDRLGNVTALGNLITGYVGGNLLPSVTDTYDVGSATYRWNNGWAKTFLVDANFNLALVASNPTMTMDTGDTLSYNRSTNRFDFGVGGSNKFSVLGTAVVPYTDLYPGITDAYSLGTSGNRWNTVWGKTHYADTNFWMSLSSTNATIRCDANDDFWYDRTANAYNWGIGSTVKATLDTTNLTGAVNVIPSANNTYNVGASGTRWATGYFTTVNAGTHLIDTNYYLALSSSNPAIAFDANDYLYYNRTTNTLVAAIGSTELLQLSATAINTATHMPLTHNTYDLGSTGTRWATGYFQNINTNGLTFTGNWNPGTDATYDMGTFTGPYRWRDIVLSRRLYMGDSTHYMELSSTVTNWNHDTNDYMQYDRAGNLWNFVVNSVAQATLTVGVLKVNQYSALTEGTANRLRFLADNTNGGARIDLYGASHSTEASRFYLDASRHYFRNISGTALVYIDGTSGYVGLGTRASGANPARLFHMATASGSCEMEMAVDNGLADNRIWNFLVDGGSGVAQNFTLRLLNDAQSSVTRIGFLINGSNADFSVYGNLLCGATTNTKDFGSSSVRWKDGYFSGQLYCAGIQLLTATNILPTATNTCDIGSATYLFNDVYATNIRSSTIYFGGNGRVYGSSSTYSQAFGYSDADTFFIYPTYDGNYMSFRLNMSGSPSSISGGLYLFCTTAGAQDTQSGAILIGRRSDGANPTSASGLCQLFVKGSGTAAKLYAMDGNGTVTQLTP